MFRSWQKAQHKTCFGLKQTTSLVINRRLAQPRGRSSFRAMATLVAYVKGSPDTNTLGDCPFCHRVLLTLEAKGLPYEKQYIDFSKKPDWIVEKFGGKVPVINEGDFWLSDSDKIVVYLEEKYPEPSLKSEVPPEVGATFFGAFRGLLLSKPEEEAEKKEKFEAELKLIDDYLAAHGPLFGGSALNATDAGLAPKLYHAKVALGHYKNYTFLEQFNAVAKYFATLEALPAWKNTDYGADLIIKGWGSHFA